MPFKNTNSVKSVYLVRLVKDNKTTVSIKKKANNALNIQ